MNLSGKRDSNSRPQPWQGCALPTELFPQMLRIFGFSAALGILKHCLLLRSLAREFRNLLWIHTSTFQRTNGIVPFCECKGTAFLRTSKLFLKKNDIFLHFSAQTRLQPYSIKREDTITSIHYDKISAFSNRPWLRFFRPPWGLARRWQGLPCSFSLAYIQRSSPPSRYFPPPLGIMPYTPWQNGPLHVISAKGIRLDNV